MVVAAVVLPPRPDRLVDQALAQLREALSAVLGESADALADVDTPRAERALDRARTLDEKVSALDETLQVAHETLLTRPLRARDRERVAEVREAAPQLDLAVRNVRVLARAVARHTRAGARPPDDLVTAIRELRGAAGALLRDRAGARAPHARRGRFRGARERRRATTSRCTPWSGSCGRWRSTCYARAASSTTRR